MSDKQLGKKIKIARIEADLTQAQIAKKLKIIPKSISRWEPGKTEPAISALKKIAKLVNKPINYFFEE
jgi:transcriptional regulator with XRE-family HTH domain